MGVSYKRCGGGGDCGVATRVVKTGGTAGVAVDEVYQCIPRTPKPGETPPVACDGACACYVAMTQHGPSGGIDDAILDEKIFRSAPKKKGDYGGMLTEAMRKADFLPDTKKGTHWNMNCACLDISSGEPVLAVSVILTIPVKKYASAIRKLEKKFGHRNVELAVVPGEGHSRAAAKSPVKKAAVKSKVKAKRRKA